MNVCDWFCACSADKVFQFIIINNLKTTTTSLVFRKFCYKVESSLQRKLRNDLLWSTTLCPVQKDYAGGTTLYLNTMHTMYFYFIHIDAIVIPKHHMYILYILISIMCPSCLFYCWRRSICTIDFKITRSDACSQQ